jgi:HD-GYP domain-containing protein (c-di-GMP phosphodiesterase class II)
MQASAEIALTHHEKWDGSGYPRGLAGDQIPIMGRIVALVDVFDALLSPRAYKEGWPLEQVIDEIRRLRGSHFDPELVDLMLKHIHLFHGIFTQFPD